MSNNIVPFAKRFRKDLEQSRLITVIKRYLTELSAENITYQFVVASDDSEFFLLKLDDSLVTSGKMFISLSLLWDPEVGCNIVEIARQQGVIREVITAYPFFDALFFDACASTEEKGETYVKLSCTCAEHIAINAFNMTMRIQHNDDIDGLVEINTVYDVHTPPKTGNDNSDGGVQ